MREFLANLGLRTGQHIMVHSSYRSIRRQFPDVTIKSLILLLEETVSEAGSIVMPAFTYCFKRSGGDYAIFDRQSSPSAVGAVSEVFRSLPGIVRTSSATHSFALWGTITHSITAENAPESPLGAGSVLEWFAGNAETHVLLLGTDFSSLSFSHYLESTARVPWYDISPWGYMQVEAVGVSTTGEQRLKEIPGCGKSFISFEKYLRGANKILPRHAGSLTGCLIPVEALLREGIPFFKENARALLCREGECRACDSRREILRERGVDLSLQSPIFGSRKGTRA